MSCVDGVGMDGVGVNRTYICGVSIHVRDRLLMQKKLLVSNAIGPGDGI